jgi:hypothetical protein
MKTHLFQKIGLIPVILLSSAVWLGAQTFNARIAGTVTDARGAPVPAARVTVHHG